MKLNEEKILKKFEKYKGYSAVLFDNEEWRESEAYELGYAQALKDSKANEMLEMLKSNLLILNNTLSYIENIERYVPMCDRSKFNTNVKLIDNKIKQIEQLIKQATEL